MPVTPGLSNLHPNHNSTGTPFVPLVVICASTTQDPPPAVTNVPPTPSKMAAAPLETAAKE